MPEPATDQVDQYGRLLRYVIRARDGLNVNVRLVAVGAAAPYFYDSRPGRFAVLLDALARRARTRHLGYGEAARIRAMTRIALSPPGGENVPRESAWLSRWITPRLLKRQGCSRSGAHILVVGEL